MFLKITEHYSLFDGLNPDFIEPMDIMGVHARLIAVLMYLAHILPTEIIEVGVSMHKRHACVF